MQSLIRKASVKSSDVFKLTAIKIHIAGFSTSKTRPIPRAGLYNKHQTYHGFLSHSPPLNSPGNPGSQTHIKDPWPLSEQQKRVIAEHPLGGTLDSVREKLRDSNEADETHRRYIEDLLLALIGSPAARQIPFPDDAEYEVEDKLFALRRDVGRGKIANLNPFRPLVRVVVDHNTNDNSDDNAIWAAVFSLLDTLTPRTRATIPPTFKGTPVETNSSWLDDSVMRENVERELLVGIKDCTFRKVGGFMDKFFNPESWRDEQKAMLEKLMTEHNGAEWTGFPATPDEKPVWDWLRSLEERFLADAPYKLHTTASANRLGERKGQMDIFIQTPITAATTTFEYKHVLIVGEHKKSYDPSRFKWDFLQLVRHVRSVFTDQPTRRFVHAFSLYASKMELWIFDRAGAYSSGPFDIHDKPDMFARALVGYVTMDNDAMGLDTFIERERYIKLHDTCGKEMRIRLNKAIYRPKAIVCRGTTCYESENNTVAKFAWVPLLGERTAEVEYLTLAKQRGVKGVAGIVAHHRITTLVEIRKGLQFPTAHRFRNEEENSHFGDLPSTTTSTDTLHVGYKREAPSDATTNTVSGSTPSKDPWEEKIYSCLVISPAGHIISRFGTIKQLLESMRDAIKAHRSLYVTGDILHRDISPNNIIITDPRIADGGFKGMLIDLDMAAKKVRDDADGPGPCPSGHGARQQITGTVPFMAIEVMRSKVDHTYRHDLESFFYVLLWMCARQSWHNGFSDGKDEQAPEWSFLERWENDGDFERNSWDKEADMALMLQRMMDQFPKSLDPVKPLCLGIRNILFRPDKDGDLVLGTPAGDPDQLYRPIIEAYDEAIGKL